MNGSMQRTLRTASGLGLSVCLPVSLAWLVAELVDVVTTDDRR